MGANAGRDGRAQIIDCCACALHQVQLIEPLFVDIAQAAKLRVAVAGISQFTGGTTQGTKVQNLVAQKHRVLWDVQNHGEYKRVSESAIIYTSYSWLAKACRVLLQLSTGSHASYSAEHAVKASPEAGNSCPTPYCICTYCRLLISTTTLLGVCACRLDT